MPFNLNNTIMQFQALQSLYTKLLDSEGVFKEHNYYVVVQVEFVYNIISISCCSRVIQSLAVDPGISYLRNLRQPHWLPLHS